MGHFSTVLTALMEQKKIINNEVIRYTGINRSTFFKMKNGQRPPSGPEMVESIARAMQLSADDRKALFSAYEIDQVGAYKYYGMEAIHRFCLSDAKISQYPVVKITIPEFGEGEHVRIFRDPSEVRAVLMGVLNETSSDIRILEDRMSDLYKTGIPQASRACPDKKFYHIFRMNESDKVEMDHQLYNVNCFQNAVEIVKRTDRYFPRHYYSSATAGAGGKAQSSFILSDRYLLTYSDAFSSAVLYKDPEMLAFYGEIFEEAMKTSTTLLKPASRLGIFSEEPWLELITDAEEEIYFLIPGIGSSFFRPGNEDLFRNYISDEVEGKEELIRFRFAYGVRLQNAVKQMGRSIHIISASNAVELFARTGYINELPRRLAVPFTEKDRADVLRKWKREAREFGMTGTREKCIPDSSAMCITATERGAFLSFLSEPGRVDARIFVTEPSIAGLIFAYLKRVAERHSMDHQEYLRFLDDLIAGLEN